MTDVHAALLAWLEADLPGFLVYPGGEFPPPGITPADGPVVTFKTRGGLPSYEGEHLQPSFQFKIYGQSEADAWANYSAVHDVLDLGRDPAGVVVWAETEVLGQPLREPDTEWPFVLAYYQAMIRNS